MAADLQTACPKIVEPKQAKSGLRVVCVTALGFPLALMWGCSKPPQDKGGSGLKKADLKRSFALPI